LVPVVRSFIPSFSLSVSSWSSDGSVIAAFDWVEGK
jgi:hypothetical protein